MLLWWRMRGRGLGWAGAHMRGQGAAGGCCITNCITFAAMKTTVLQIRVPLEVRDALKARAEHETGGDMSKLLRPCITKLLEGVIQKEPVVQVSVIQSPEVVLQTTESVIQPKPVIFSRSTEQRKVLKNKNKALSDAWNQARK